jgi:hypothetical protein
MGSVPLVALNRACTSSGEIVHAVEETWQLLQVRPFVPRFWKNGLVTSIAPFVLYVPSVPDGSVVRSGLGILPAPAVPAKIPINTQTKTIVARIHAPVENPQFSPLAEICQGLGVHLSSISESPRKSLQTE